MRVRCARSSGLGLGRLHVLSAWGRDDAAERWHDGDFGPESAMAKAAPGYCGSCGFLVPVGGALGQQFGLCANEMAPADGRVVDLGYGCGAHSETPVVEGTGVMVSAAVVAEDQNRAAQPGLAAGSPRFTGVCTRFGPPRSFTGVARVSGARHGVSSCRRR